MLDVLVVAILRSFPTELTHTAFTMDAVSANTGMLPLNVSHALTQIFRTTDLI